MAYRFKLTYLIPASPKEVYDTWLSSRGHTAMTGSAAKMSSRTGGRFTAWGGYITGKNLALDPGRRIVQSWRTSNFTDEHEDSKITVTLAPVKAGTRLTLVHANVPDGQTSYEKGGWLDHYFRPMEAYFAKAIAKPATKRASGKRRTDVAPPLRKL